jgi:hypothetical protein
VNVFAEFRIYYDSYVCFGVGWESEDILFTIEMAQYFQNCYKTLLKSLCDFSNWRGQTAKWIDECSDSNDEEITLY